MRKVNLHWMSNRDWWEVKDGIPKLRADAPEEAQESYAHYLEQHKDDED